jgi:hypothetical protein
MDLVLNPLKQQGVAFDIALGVLVILCRPLECLYIVVSCFDGIEFGLSLVSIAQQDSRCLNAAVTLHPALGKMAFG